MIEESETKLDPQNASHSFVDRRLREFVLLQELRTKGVEAAAHHFHVDTGVQSRGSGVFFIAGESVIDQLSDGGVVAHYKTIELPFLPQHLRQRESIGRGWHTVDVIEGTHQRPNTSINGCFERWKVDLAQCLLGEIRGVVIATTFSSAVSHPVFGTGKNLVGRTIIGTLKTAHTSASKCGAEIWIFSGAFGDSSPTWIACDVDHRCAGPTHSGADCFLRGYGS